MAVAVAVFGAMTGLARAQSATAVAGCYQFDRPYFTWTTMASEPTPQVRDSSRVLQLKTTLGPPPNRGYAGTVPPSRPFYAESPGARSGYLSFWRFIDSNSIQVNWGSPMHPPFFELVVRGDSLIGSVTFLPDTVSKSRVERASAVRITCP
jgi:hypothetical protein